ncbi:MAG TPA: hypothetical protein VM425_07515 [Myxococcota bacterium]|nr:hypothetical protein [Myxococcota bacterium]
MRALIYVPIVHSEVDLGTMADEVRRRFQEAFGADEWARRLGSVEAMWAGLRTKLFALPISWPCTRLYQDGLPVCDREREIVRDLAAKSSRNHQLLIDLMERGSTLMGTESPKLLVKEYRRIQRLVQVSQGRAPDEGVEELKREGETILCERDGFIAGRIDSTLQEGETGILFLGLLHRVDELLYGKFEVRHMIHNLPFGADPWRQLRERCGHVD